MNNLMEIQQVDFKHIKDFGEATSNTLYNESEFFFFFFFGYSTFLFIYLFQIPQVFSSLSGFSFSLP